MNLAQEEFDRRIASIHRLNHSVEDILVAEEAIPVDVRHAEFEALADTFLGANFDPEKRKQVEGLQIAAHQQQADLYRRMRAGEMTDEQYVEAANSLMEESLKDCEVVLGAEDFQRLFGISPQEVSGLIDRKALLQPDPSAEAETPIPPGFQVDARTVSTTYANFCRLTGTPEELFVEFGMNAQIIPTTSESVRLTLRLILNFFTAKRLMIALQMAVQQHEYVYGLSQTNVGERRRQDSGRLNRLRS